MPDTAQAINEIYQDQRPPIESPRGNDPGENGAQRPLNIVPPKTEQDSSSNPNAADTEVTEQGKLP